MYMFLVFFFPLLFFVYILRISYPLVFIYLNKFHVGKSDNWELSLRQMIIGVNCLLLMVTVCFDKMTWKCLW